MVVKKLIDEDEFQPEKRKKPVIIDMKYTTSNLEIVGISPPQSKQSERSSVKNPVEIVGIRPTSGASSYLTPVNQQIHTEEKSEAGDELDEESPKVEKVKLVVKRKKRAESKLGEALDDGTNYHRIIDSLTDRLANSGESKSTTQQTQTIRAKSVKDKDSQRTSRNSPVKSLEKRLIPRQDDLDPSIAISHLSSNANMYYKNRLVTGQY